jgi:hypothetical protein
MFLFPKLLRPAVYLFAFHMIIVCVAHGVSAHMAWAKPFAPSLEGQYINQNVALIALVITLIACSKLPSRKSA